MVRKTAFKEAGGFNPNQAFAEDFDLWWRISWRHTIHQMNEVLMRYRCGHSSPTLYPRFDHWGRYLKMRRDTPPHLR